MEKTAKKPKTLTLKAKKWNMLDCFLLVFKAAPIHITVEFLLGFLTSFVPSLSIFVTAGFVDTAIAILGGNAPRNDIFIPLAGMFVLAIVPHILGTIEFFVDNTLYPKVSYLVEEAFLRKKASLKFEHIENSKTHDLIGRASNNSGDTMLGRVWRLRGIINMAIRFVSIITVVFVQVWWSGIVSVAVMIPAVWFAVRNGVEQYKAFSDTEKLERVANVYHTVLRHKDFLEERTTFRYAPYVMGRWHEIKRESDSINLKVSMRAGIRDNATWILTWFMGLAVMLSLVPAVSGGILSAGMFVGITNSILHLVNLISGNISWTVRWFVQSLKNLRDMTEYTNLTDEEGALDAPAVIPSDSFESIEFRDVTFRYPGTERDILKNCSFKLKAGEHYAFVGVNGAGKTTITKLLTGLYDNYEGEIFLNGKNLREYSLAEKKGFFTVVYQDFAKYQIEFRDNIKLGDINKDDDDRMMEAVRDIDLEGVLEGLHSGADTPLGKVSENGVDLSGGEWQRVAIARSLYSDAPMKILDEPTAALDPIAESGIYEMFRDITKGKSAIFITHRLGGAKIADKILVLDDGRVAEFGSHNELLKQGGIYAEMFNTQKGWYED